LIIEAKAKAKATQREKAICHLTLSFSGYIWSPTLSAILKYSDPKDLEMTPILRHHFSAILVIFLAFFPNSSIGFVGTKTSRSSINQQLVRKPNTNPNTNANLLVNYASNTDYDSLSTLEDIKDDVKKYITIRNAAIFGDGEIMNSTVISEDYGKDNNPLEMFRPTGWYRDNERLEFERRIDR
jgi:hypothetical protein